MRFDMGLLYFGDIKFVFKDEIRMLKSSFDIADIDPDFRREVAAGIGFIKIHIFRFIVNDRHTRIHRLGGVEDRRKQLILNLDQVQSCFCDFG